MLTVSCTQICDSAKEAAKQASGALYERWSCDEVKLEAFFAKLLVPGFCKDARSKEAVCKVIIGLLASAGAKKIAKEGDCEDVDQIKKDLSQADAICDYLE